MTQSRPHKSLLYALTANALLLGAILIVLIARGERGPFASIALAQDRGGGAMPAAPAPIAGGGGLFLMPAQLAPNQWGCYVMDVDRQTLCAYQYVPSSHQLQFVAARSFQWDRRLENFNTDNPSPRDVQRMVERQQDNARVTQPPDKKEH